MRKAGTVEYWLIWAENFGGSRYAVCDTAKTPALARKKDKECRDCGGAPHRIVKVQWL